MDLHPIQGGVKYSYCVHATAACYWSRDKLWPDEPLGSYRLCRLYLPSYSASLNITEWYFQLCFLAPAFFRSNPACCHRLIPWLTRDLRILLNDFESHVDFVLQIILSLITKYVLVLWYLILILVELLLKDIHAQTRFKLIWPRSSLKTTKMSKKCIGQKGPGVNGLNQ